MLANWLIFAYAINSRTVRSFEHAALRGGCALQAAADARSAVAAVVGAAVSALAAAIGLMQRRVVVVAVLMMMVGQRLVSIGHGLRLRVALRLPLGIGAACDAAQSRIVGVIWIAAGTIRGGFRAVECALLQRAGWLIWVSGAVPMGPAVNAAAPGTDADAALANLLLHGVLPIEMGETVHFVDVATLLWRSVDKCRLIAPYAFVKKFYISLIFALSLSFHLLLLSHSLYLSFC